MLAISDLHVIRCEPGADAVLLQISVDALGELASCEE